MGLVDSRCADYRAHQTAWNVDYERFQRGGCDTQAVGRLYGCLLTQDYTLERLTRIIQEACLVGDYYQRLPRTGTCIASSTTLIEQWQKVLPCVRLNTQWVDQDKRTCSQRIACVEEYLRKRGGSVATLKAGLIKTIENHLAASDTAIVTAAANKLESVTKQAQASATLPTQEADKKEEIGKARTVEDILADAEFVEVKDAKIFGKKGGYKEAQEDFEGLQPLQVKDIPKNNVGKTGVLSDGRRVNVRINSTDQRPTLEIQPPKGASGKVIKIRYGTK
jgi:hypothetical protein